MKLFSFKQDPIRNKKILDERINEHPLGLTRIEQQLQKLQGNYPDVIIDFSKEVDIFEWLHEQQKKDVVALCGNEQERTIAVFDDVIGVFADHVLKATAYEILVDFRCEHGIYDTDTKLCLFIMYKEPKPEYYGGILYPQQITFMFGQQLTHYELITKKH